LLLGIFAIDLTAHRERLGLKPFGSG
jgi:hypothetical protein